MGVLERQEKRLVKTTLEDSEFDSIYQLMDILHLDLVKITTANKNPYILYKKDDIKNYFILSKSSIKSIVDDLVYYFYEFSNNWYLKIISEKPTEKKAISLVYDFVTYESERVNQIINDPAEELIFNENGIKYFNLFENTKYLVEKPNVEKDWSTIQKVLFNLCNNNGENYEWVINWLSCLYQYPMYRFTTSLIFIGEKGSGKGMFSKVMRFIFGKCCYSANSKDLISNFNSHLFEGKLLLLANEIVDQKNKYQFSNDLKEFVTEETLSVEKKFSDRYLAKNYIKLVLFSNSNQPIAIEEGDRRYAVFKSKKIDMSYSERNDFFENEDFFKNQVEGFCFYLENNLCDFESIVTEPIMTQEKQDIINLNITDFKADILDILDYLVPSWIKHIDKKYYIPYNIVYNEYNGKQRKYDLSRMKFTNKLKINDFSTDKKTIDSENRVYIKVPDGLVNHKKSIVYPKDDLYDL